MRSTHSGLLDYGPHALAFLLDLGLRPELTWGSRVLGQWKAISPVRPFPIDIVTGNGFHAPRMVVRVEIAGDDGARSFSWAEEGEEQVYRSDLCGGAPMRAHRRDLALRNFCRAFLAGEPSDTLRISCEAMRLLLPAEAMRRTG